MSDGYDRGRGLSTVQNLTTVEGSTYYREVMGRAVPDPIVYIGDVDGDRDVDLSDAILSLRILTGGVVFQDPGGDADVNDDGKIGIEETIYIMQQVAGD